MAFASGFHTPSPKTLNKGKRKKIPGGGSEHSKSKSNKKSTIKKTPLSTLLKKASENRVLRDAKLVSMCNHVLSSAGKLQKHDTSSELKSQRD